MAYKRIPFSLTTSYTHQNRNSWEFFFLLRMNCPSINGKQKVEKPTNLFESRWQIACFYWNHYCFAVSRRRLEKCKSKETIRNSISVYSACTTHCTQTHTQTHTEHIQIRLSSILTCIQYCSTYFIQSKSHLFSSMTDPNSITPHYRCLFCLIIFCITR